MLIVVSDVPPVDHRFGSIFILSGEGDVSVVFVFVGRLFQPLLGAAVPNKVVAGWVCRGRGGRSGRCVPSESGWLSLVGGAGVPWYSASALPEVDKLLSTTGFAPGSVVELVYSEFVPRSVYCMSAGWAM